MDSYANIFMEIRFTNEILSKLLRLFFTITMNLVGFDNANSLKRNYRIRCVAAMLGS